MKWNKELLTVLNSLLADELIVINQYMVQSEMCANWGYSKLHAAIRKQAIDNQPLKSMFVTSIHLLNFVYHDKSCCRDKVNRATGLRAVVMVFASLSGLFYLDVTNPAHLSGLSHLDNFIVTRNLSPFIGTVQKHMPTPTQTATSYTTGPLCATI